MSLVPKIKPEDSSDGLDLEGARSSRVTVPRRGRGQENSARAKC